MSMQTLLIMGVLVGGVVAVLFRCKHEILAPLCDVWPEGELPFDVDELIAEHNALPTIADNPKTNEYRSTTLVKRDPVQLARTDARQKKQGTAAAVEVARAAQRKQSLTPKQHIAEIKSSDYCKIYYNSNPTCPCPKGMKRVKGKCTAGSNFATSLFSTTRIAI